MMKGKKNKVTLTSAQSLSVIAKMYIIREFTGDLLEDAFKNGKYFCYKCEWPPQKKEQ